MRKKYQKLPQNQINEIVVERLLKELSTWDEECIEDFVFCYPEVFAENMDEILDEQAENDAFGTEKQCDPRGDFRSGDWNMWEIQ